MSSLLLYLCMTLSVPALSGGEGWRGIVPLRSTRADVERLLGPPADPSKQHASFHDLEKEVVTVFYASGPPCGSDMVSGWRVPRGTVVRLIVSPKINLQPSDLQADLSKYQKTVDLKRADIITYSNKERGESITVSHDQVVSVEYFPTTKDSPLSCPSSPTSAGDIVRRSHPRLDNYLDISFSDEKVRLDNFAIHLQRHPEAKGYIVIYHGKQFSASQARRRAERAKKYLTDRRGIESRRITIVEGGQREKLTIELYLASPGATLPASTRSADPSEVRVSQAVHVR